MKRILILNSMDSDSKVGFNAQSWSDSEMGFGSEIGFDSESFFLILKWVLILKWIWFWNGPFQNQMGFDS